MRTDRPSPPPHPHHGSVLVAARPAGTAPRARIPIVVLVATVALMTAACAAPTATTVTGASSSPATRGTGASTGSPASRRGSSPAGSVPIATTGSALVATDAGLASVPIGSSTPAWTYEGAAALDGSALFTTTATTDAPAREATTVLQRDPRTGAQEQCCWGQRGDLDVAAVAPGGRWVALTTRPRPTRPDVHGLDAPPPRPLGPDQTHLVVLRPPGGRVADLVLEGDVEPEAFSPDGSLLYTLRHEQGGYRVQTVDLATGTQQPTFGRHKEEGEDMQGTAVMSVLNADRSIQSTLYLDPDDRRHPAFVHVLDLQNNWAHCADLPATGANGAVGWDTLTVTPSGTLLVGDATDGMVAEIQIAAVHDPDGGVTVDVREDPAPPALPASLRAVPGFRRLVALVP